MQPRSSVFVCTQVRALLDCESVHVRTHTIVQMGLPVTIIIWLMALGIAGDETGLAMHASYAPGRRRARQH